MGILGAVVSFFFSKGLKSPALNNIPGAKQKQKQKRRSLDHTVLIYDSLDLRAEQSASPI